MKHRKSKKNPDAFTARNIAITVGAGVGVWLVIRELRKRGTLGNGSYGEKPKPQPSHQPASARRQPSFWQWAKSVAAVPIRTQDYTSPSPALAKSAMPPAPVFMPTSTPVGTPMLRQTVIKPQYETYDPNVTAINAETAKTLAQAQQILVANRAMEQLKAAYSAAGKAPPGSTEVPASSGASEAYAQQWADYATQAPPAQVSWLTGALDMVAGQFSYVPALGAEKASELARVGIGTALTGQIEKFGRQPTQEETNRIAALADTAGFTAQKVFSGGLARGEFTTADITDAALNAQGYGAQRIKSYMENAMAGILAPKVAGFLAESQMKALGGGQLSDAEIKSVASGIERDVKRAVDEIARTDKNFVGRSGYIESVAKESAFGQIRSLVVQKVAPQISEKLSQSIGGYIPKQAVDAISLSAAAETGVAFAQSQGSMSQEQLMQIGTHSVAKNMLPYVPGIGEQIARAKLDSYMGDVTKLSKAFGRDYQVLTEEQKALACKQIGQDLGQWASERVAAKDYAALNEKNLTSVGKEIALRRVGPMIARSAVDITAGEFGKREKVSEVVDKSAKALDVIRGQFPEVNDDPKVKAALDILSSVLRGRSQ